MNISNIKKVIIIFSILISVSYAQTEAITQDKDILNLLTGNFDSMQSFKANFIQRIGNTVYRGEIYYKSPNKFKLVYTSPSSRVISRYGNNQTILSDGKKLIIYAADIHVVSEQDLGEYGDGGIQTKKGVIRLTSEYYFNFYNNRSVESLNAFRATDLAKYGVRQYSSVVDSYLDSDTRSVYHMYLTPKEKSTAKSGFIRIHLWIDRSGMIVRSISLSTTKQAIEFVFTDIEKNPVEVSDNTFEYKYPRNVQIIRNNLTSDN